MMNAMSVKIGVGPHWTIIDVEDYRLIEGRSLSHYSNQNKSPSFYAKSYIKSGHRIPVHTLIMNPPPGHEVDHINFNTLDNRKSNLRVCTKSQNIAAKRSPIGKSGYRGVVPHRSADTWQARITVRRKTICLGNYKTKEDAALAYNEAAIKYFGEFARTNIIGEPK